MKASQILTIGASLVAGDLMATELTVNPGFENPFVLSGAYTVPGGEYASVPGWVLNQSVLVCAPDSWPAYEGRQSACLHGTNAGAYLEQTFPTIPGLPYRLAFQHANNPDSDLGTFSVRLVGSITLMEQILTHSGSTRAAMNYTLFETNFTADFVQTTLRLTRLSGNWGQAPIFDAISFAPLFCSPHKATALPVLTNGFIVGATITDAGCGYTNPPMVLIQGGGGLGATASAVINDGIVVAINITDAGCCYSTNPPPRIVIASPPFEPTVSIRISKVKVTQNIVLGRNYVLEVSTNMTTWTAVGTQFTAESESVMNEFDVDDTGRFFRIREVP